MSGNGKSDSVESLVEDAGKTASEVGREIHHHAENAKSEMVKALYEAAKTLRRESREAGAGDEVQERVDDLAKGFEKAAGYLKRNSYGDIGEDAVQKAKRYPTQTFAIILVVGVIIGLLLRGSSPRDQR